MKPMLIAITMILLVSTSFAAERKWPYSMDEFTLGADYQFNLPSLTNEGEKLLSNLELNNADFDCVSDISLNISKSNKKDDYGITNDRICSVSISVAKGDTIQTIEFSKQQGVLDTSLFGVLTIIPVIEARMGIKNDCAYLNTELQKTYELLNEKSLFCDSNL